MGKQKVNAVEAFVTFESHESSDSAVAESADFGVYNGQTCELRTPPEPESLHWDRLEIQPFEQSVRQCLILAVTLALLMSGFAAAAQADILKGNTAYLGGCDDAMSPTRDRCVFYCFSGCFSAVCATDLGLFLARAATTRAWSTTDTVIRSTTQCTRPAVSGGV